MLKEVYFTFKKLNVKSTHEHWIYEGINDDKRKGTGKVQDDKNIMHGW